MKENKRFQALCAVLDFEGRMSDAWGNKVVFSLSVRVDGVVNTDTWTFFPGRTTPEPWKARRWSEATGKEQKKKIETDWASNLCCDNWRIKQINCNAHQRLFTRKWIICIKLWFDKRKEEGYFHFYSKPPISPYISQPIYYSKLPDVYFLFIFFYLQPVRHLVFLHLAFSSSPLPSSAPSVFIILGQLLVEWWMGALWVLICGAPPVPIVLSSSPLCDSKLVSSLAPLTHTMPLRQRLAPSDSWLPAETWLPPRHAAATAVKSHWGLMRGFSNHFPRPCCFPSCWMFCPLGTKPVAGTQYVLLVDWLWAAHLAPSLRAWDVLSAFAMSWPSAINFPSAIYCAVVKRDDICWTALQVRSLSYLAVVQYTVVPLPRWLLCPFCTLASSRSYFSVPWGSITVLLHEPPNFTAWDLWCVLTSSSSFSPLCSPPLPC